MKKQKKKFSPQNLLEKNRKKVVCTRTSRKYTHAVAALTKKKLLHELGKGRKAKKIKYFSKYQKRLYSSKY